MKKNNFLITTFLCILFLSIGCKKDEFKITYDANGGIGKMPQQFFEAGKRQWLFPNTFVCEGYKFKGWNTFMNGGGKEFEDQQYISVTSDMTLYAQWTPNENSFFVFFRANGGEGNMEPQVFSQFGTQNLNENRFTRVNYLFKDWNTKEDGTGKRYKDMEEIWVSANMELFAQWAYNEMKPCQGIPIITDIDGNKYNTVLIGSQCWMRENLRTTRFNSGDSIPIRANESDWSFSTTPAMCYYNNSMANADKYGALYNGYAAKRNNLCPKGWHVPTNDEWDILIGYLGGVDIAGHHLKAAYDWYSNGNGSNESGFSALPAGVRGGDGTYNFSRIGERGGFWSSTYYDIRLCSRVLRYYLASVEEQTVYLDDGNSVRCIKN